MSNFAGKINDNKNIIQSTSGTIASIGLEQVGKRVAGVLITPATWAVNNAVNGSKPNGVDIGVWLSGFISAPASIVTGTVKALVDDDIDRKLQRVRSKEPGRSARFIQPCHGYSSSSPSINAMTIANKGGTAWITSVGLWVYITDADGKLIADYQPKEYVTMYRPKKPYKKKSSGGFDWDVIRK